MLLSPHVLTAPLLCLDDEDNDLLPVPLLLVRCPLLVFRTLSLVSSGTNGSGRHDVFSETLTAAWKEKDNMTMNS